MWFFFFVRLLDVLDDIFEINSLLCYYDMFDFNILLDKVIIGIVKFL